MSELIEVLRLRVRYSETDQMGTFYNSHALDWFECARTELMRQQGLAYTDIEARGTFLPLVEAHVQYQGRARYDDLLVLFAGWSPEGRARLRFDVEIKQVETGRPVAKGYTIHAFTDSTGKAVRPPAWLVEAIEKLPRSGVKGDTNSTD
jgi:acyl-CoA thioester hydrolase